MRKTNHASSLSRPLAMIVLYSPVHEVIVPFKIKCKQIMIGFASDTLLSRIKIWNHNVNRDYTSVWSSKKSTNFLTVFECRIQQQQIYLTTNVRSAAYKYIVVGSVCTDKRDLQSICKSILWSLWNTLQFWTWVSGGLRLWGWLFDTSELVW